MDHHVAVVGGTGRTGRMIVQRLLARGESVLALGRRAPRPQQALPAGAVFRSADVRDPESLPAVLGDCSAVVYCVEPGTENAGPDRPETTMHRGVLHVLAAATARGLRPHMVLVSQIHTTHLGHPLNAYGRLLDWRRAGEDAVRDSGLRYTVVRPGWLRDDRADGEGIRLVQGDRETGRLSRQDLAETCVQVLYRPSSAGLTFEVFNGTPAVNDAWEQEFAGLGGDLVTAR